jgi:hypothetical protein
MLKTPKRKAPERTLPQTGLLKTGPQPRKSPGPDEIADMATHGEDVSGFFTNRFTVVRPVQRVNVDLTHGMLRELDERAARLNVSRQAVIKTLLARALNEERRGPVRKPQA